MVRRTIFCLLLVVGITLTSTPALAYQPREGAKFNVPIPWGTPEQNFRIVRHVEAAIDNTRPTADDPNPVILISSFLMDRKQSAVALMAACKRGVSVRVILDEQIGTPSARALVKTLNADNVLDENDDGVPDGPARRGPCDSPLAPEPPAEGGRQAPRAGNDVDSNEVWSVKRTLKSVATPTDESFTWGSDRSYARSCVGSCRGGGGNMHSKFYAFSNSGAGRQVVMVSSSNLNLGGAKNGWNDLYTMTGRPDSFAVYRRIHREMTEDTPAGDGKEEIQDGPFLSRFYPMKNATKANDPVLADLNQIRCRSDLGRTQVHVSMFGWRGTRGTYLADKVFSLKRDGCNVKVIFGAPSKEMAIYLRQKARATKVPLYNSRWDFDRDGQKEIRAHTKYVLVKGAFGRDRSAYEVMTGSANWVNGGLDRGDETTLNISLRSAYQQYLANWDDIRRKSVRVAG